MTKVCLKYIYYLYLFEDQTSNEIFEDDDDESFYNDITFEETKLKISHNPSKNLISNHPTINNFKLNENTFQQTYSHTSDNKIGRANSPAISAKSIQINRTTQSPGSQKRPPH